MRKTTLGQAFRNIVIGLILMCIALYWFYLDFFLVNFSLDRACIIDDAVRTGWNSNLFNWYQYTLMSENNFIAHSTICQLVTKLPTFGKLIFTAITMFLLWFSGTILYYNAKHVSIIIKSKQQLQHQE